jgi:hypothetical protein
MAKNFAAIIQPYREHIVGTGLQHGSLGGQRFAPSVGSSLSRQSTVIPQQFFLHGRDCTRLYIVSAATIREEPPICHDTSLGVLPVTRNTASNPAQTARRLKLVASRRTSHSAARNKARRAKRKMAMSIEP